MNKELVPINLAKLKKLRVEKGFTQQEMAEKLGYKGKSGYCQLENGTVKMTLEQAKKIAEILGDDIEKIFF
ncbi:MULTISPECIES: helix-turn-helix transcriptional regulator [Halanaerobiaceae]|uniref:helix-turn-helix transcriptional regulator n=1 Tax=Halanaerobiaceae TaxID=972 RepID=UPI00197AC4A5|nr:MULTISPECIES: helix-turn-helix transcriptional regulator [Halanaerobiaceae]